MKINSIAASSLVVLSLLFTAAGARAQSAAQARVPFAFKVGTAQMPAGNYEVEKEMGSEIITVRNLQTGTTVQAMARRESPSNKTDKLVFRRSRQPVRCWPRSGEPRAATESPYPPPSRARILSSPRKQRTPAPT